MTKIVIDNITQQSAIYRYRR